ncbi:minor capsid protein [Thermosediminibacter oceani]|uniref:Phage head morphogenesis protein, SPP1 gp7 family n=1 Tax=Thermosediminibacter oceani (strain ATCC BAA-1034 / DSM 16646 / JW/IW-1228P) TaxID=555079 RepID=D9S3R1_THEOJ|nr:minor capsid protein [Thermosediminibacter oceani]ADL08038.1 phage head morphogenesis protein, SPP1 gp7 family [Thermosediminibacter oceani DSM 16646]
MDKQKQLQKEIEKIHIQMQRKANKDSLPILQAYKRALNDIRGELGKIFAKYAKDGVLSVSDQQRYAVLIQMQKKLTQMARELGQIEDEKTTEILKDIYKESFYRTANVIEKGVDVSIDYSILRPEFVEKAVKMPIEGKTFSDRIWDNKEKLVKNLRKNLEDGMIQGKSIDKLSKDIAQTMGSGAYEAKRIINTEMARCMTQAQKEVYKSSGVVQKVLFSATLDDRTSQICQNLDGKYFDLDDAPNIPEDTHPNCRSTLVPVVEGWNPSQRRDQETGEIIDYKSYEDWQASKSF